MKAQEIIDYVLSIAPFRDAYGDIPRDDALVFGSPDIEVTGIATTWSATTEVIKKAIDAGINFIITHEFLFWPPYETVWYRDSKQIMSKVPNIRRGELLKGTNMAVYMTHKNWDAAANWGMCDSFPAFLGFTEEVKSGRFTRVHKIEPLKLKDLAGRIRKKMGLCNIRIAGDPERQVSKIGTAVGGLGQLFGLPEELYNLGAEAVVFGEVLDYTVRCCLEHGMAAVETSHVLSENPAVENLAKKLKEQYPETKVFFIDAGYPFSSNIGEGLCVRE